MFVGQIQGTNVEYLADHLLIQWQVTHNPLFSGENVTYAGKITLMNTGLQNVKDLDWEIYFCSIKLLFPYQLAKADPDYGHPIEDTNILLYHQNGCLFKLKPNSDFAGFQRDVPIVLPFECHCWSVSRTDIMPNWFVTDEHGKNPKTITYTAGEDLKHMGTFDTEQTWKRATNEDQYNPFTPEFR